MTFLPCLLVLVGCPQDPVDCPQATITPATDEIPEGQSQVDLVVDVDDPNPESGLEIITELTSDAGGFGDPFARETTFTCAFDRSGEVEICANAMYVNPEESTEQSSDSESGIGMTEAALRKPHVRLRSPLTCSETLCTTVVCPDTKNECPLVSDLSVELTQTGSDTATVSINAEDPDDNPEPLTTTLVTEFGSFEDPNARDTTYTCDAEVGGIIEICVVVSDGDAACEVQRCTTVLCPGEPRDNTCPVIASFTANPITIPAGETSAEIRVDVSDPDSFPDPLRTELSAETGVFEDRFTTSTVFNCGEPGPVEMCVEASDGDRTCDQERCITVQCPSDIPNNLCPQLFVLNAIPSRIPEGQTTTMIQTRGQDTDELPIPLVLTLRALWGTITDDENLQLPNNVVAQNAMYECDRPGDTEICVDATDGACVKTLCIEVECPSDIPPP